MAIYVQSRGKNQDQDYRWLKIKSNEYFSDNPDFLLQEISNLKVRPIDLIESQKPSIILVSRHNDYCLLVTGLNARGGRTDFANRSVRNSILWIYKKDSENVKIRSLLIRALRGELDVEIDKTINISGKYGFEVDYDQLKQSLSLTLAIDNNKNTNLNDNKLGKNCDYLREELALELESNTLPDREGLLVLVTNLKSASALKETGVWRGLSNRVESEEFKDYSFSVTENQQGQKKTVYLSLAIAMILIIAITITALQITKTQKLKPESKQKTSSIDNQTSIILQKKLSPISKDYLNNSTPKNFPIKSNKFQK